MLQAVKNAIKTAYSTALARTGALAAWLRVRPGRRRPWILNYHHVQPAAFASHLRALCRHYTVVSLDACCGFVATGAPLPPNSVVLTFDDGYRQLHEDIFPLLKAHRAPATVFVPTEPVDSGQPLWFNRVKTLVRTARGESLRLGGRTFPLGPDREAAYVALVRFLNERSLAERDALLAELLAGVELPAERMARYQPLTWDQMRAAPPLVTWGAHTRTHPCLSRLTRAEAEEEILGSKQRLEDELGVPVRHFAYPFGGPDSFTDETEAIVRAGGFASACTTERGACQAGGPVLRLPRILFDGSVGGAVVAARLSGLWLFLTT